MSHSLPNSTRYVLGGVWGLFFFGTLIQLVTEVPLSGQGDTLAQATENLFEAFRTQIMQTLAVLAEHYTLVASSTAAVWTTHLVLRRRKKGYPVFSIPVDITGGVLTLFLWAAYFFEIDNIITPTRSTSQLLGLYSAIAALLVPVCVGILWFAEVVTPAQYAKNLERTTAGSLKIVCCDLLMCLVILSGIGSPILAMVLVSGLFGTGLAVLHALAQIFAFVLSAGFLMSSQQEYFQAQQTRPAGPEPTR